jgi:hypothetical protein
MGDKPTSLSSRNRIAAPKLISITLIFVRSAGFEPALSRFEVLILNQLDEEHRFGTYSSPEADGA